MRIFSDDDAERLENSVKSRVQEDKEMFFSYFEDLALDHYIAYIAVNKEMLLSNIETEIRKHSPNTRVKIPIACFPTFRETTSEYRSLRRQYQEEQLINNNTPSCYFQSMSGIHITDLRAIYRHSSFRQVLNEILGLSLLSIKLTSEHLGERDGVMEYSNTLWLQFNTRYTSRAKSHLA
jgi:hypothetical protein